MSLRIPKGLKQIDTKGFSIRSVETSKGHEGEDLRSGKLYLHDKYVADVIEGDYGGGLIFQNVDPTIEAQTNDYPAFDFLVYDLFKLEDARQQMLAYKKQAQTTEEIFHLYFRARLVKYDGTVFTSSHPNVTEENIQSILREADPYAYVNSYEIEYYELDEDSNVQGIVFAYDMSHNNAGGVQ